MSLVARHKKPGGFRKLVCSIETTPFEKRNTILDAMNAEDAEFVLHVKESLFAFEEFLKVDNSVITELVENLVNDMRVVAIALFHVDQALIDKFVKNMLPHSARRFLDATAEILQVKQFERISAQFKIIAKARELEHKHIFVLKKLSGNFPE